MCRLKSGIILKDQVFVPDYDRHTCMLKELGIEDNEINAKTLFVRAELSPINDNIFSDISTWQFNIDQDILPDWFVCDYDKQRMIEAIKEWTKDHVFENVDGLELKGNDTYYLKNCKNVKAYDSCKINAYDYSTVNAYGNCKVYAQDNCTVYTCDDCTVNAYDDCKVNAYGNCEVYAQDNCTVNTYDDCTVNAYDDCKVNAYDYSTVNAQNNCKVYAYGNCEVYAQNNCTVNTYDDCTVNTYDDCTVNAYDDCKVNAYDNCTVNAYGKCTVNAHHDSIIKSIDDKPYDKNLKLFNNAIFINKATKTIFYQNEDYKFVKIGKSGERV